MIFHFSFDAFVTLFVASCYCNSHRSSLNQHHTKSITNNNKNTTKRVIYHSFFPLVSILFRVSNRQHVIRSPFPLRSHWRTRSLTHSFNIFFFSLRLFEMNVFVTRLFWFSWCHQPSTACERMCACLSVCVCLMHTNIHIALFAILLL